MERVCKEDVISMGTTSNLEKCPNYFFPIALEVHLFIH